MATTLSYAEVIKQIAEDPAEQAFLLEIIDAHKNWGHFTAKLQSSTIVLMVDRIKLLQEKMTDFYAAHPEVKLHEKAAESRLRRRPD